MSEATFTFRVEEDLKTAFGETAKANDLTGAQLLRGFMRDYVKRQKTEAEYDAWFRREVQIGIDSANAGNLISAEEVEMEFSKRRSESIRQIKG
jgi:predicted transcriptional regulator